MEAVLNLDLDPTFEPQQRARSNTWPLPRPDNYCDIKDENDVDTLCGVVGVGHGNVTGMNMPLNGDQVSAIDLLNGDLNGKLSSADCAAGVGGGAGAPKKNSSRRNAWGNMSYADLITQAIQSSQDKRLTLSQIYDWMVQNVPYFKDKGDSNSSAGWKNSIRHNLSLHNRFMRVQNEGTGKSSWWMINPDAKPGKSARRRATSMETSKYEKKRGRVKKKVEALRAGLATTPSPSSSVSEGLDMFPESPQIHTHPFQLSPGGDFRPRASSNASSIGRLSPIPAVESELQDGPWSPDYPTGLYHSAVGNHTAHLDRFSADQLVDNIAESMKIRENGFITNGGAEQRSSGGPGVGSDLPNHMSVPSNGYSMCHSHGGYSAPAAPGYAAQAGQEYRSHPGLPRSPQRLMGVSAASVTTASDLNPAPPPYSIANIRGLSPAQNLEQHSAYPGNSSDSGALSSQVPILQQQGSYAPLLSRFPSANLIGSGAPSTSSSSASTGSNGGGSGNNSNNGTPEGSGLLRAALAHGVVSNSSSPSHNTSPSSLVVASAVTTPSQMMSQLMGVLNNNEPMPNDLELNLDSLQGGFDCNVDEVIKHELSMDGSLDFNFSQQQLHHHHQLHQLHQQHLHQQQLQQHHQLQQQQQHHLLHHQQPMNDYNLGFGAANGVPSLLNDRPQVASQPPPLCSIAALTPGRSWVR